MYLIGSAPAQPQQMGATAQAWFAAVARAWAYLGGAHVLAGWGNENMHT
jgi:hypothetical protein